jgi:hypothetical protein
MIPSYDANLGPDEIFGKDSFSERNGGTGRHCWRTAQCLQPLSATTWRARRFHLRDLRLYVLHDLVDREARRLLAGRIRDEVSRNFGSFEHALLGDVAPWAVTTMPNFT